MPRAENLLLKEDLLKEAIHLLDLRGDESFSMRDLAKRVGYAVTAIYRYYESRADLLREMQLRFFHQMGESILVMEDGSALDRIREMGRRFITWGQMYPARYRLMFQSTEQDSLLSPSDRVVARSGLRILEEMVAEGIAGGEIRGEKKEAGDMALMLFASLHGLMSLALSQRLDEGGSGELVAFYDRIANRWLEGFIT